MPDRFARVLVVHNRYQQHGGEDTAVDADITLLRARGHVVTSLLKDNDTLIEANRAARAGAAIGTVWSRSSRREVAAAIEQTRPDVVHVHNTFPLWSASVLAAANDAGVPVVAVLHNYRLVCAAPYLFRDGQRCVDCLHRTVAWPALVHRCYHDALGHTAVQVATQAVHRSRSTWGRRVDQFLAVSAASGALLADAGVVPRGKLFVRPNFLADDPGPRSAGADGGRFLFAGRLVAEKGWLALLDALVLAPAAELDLVGTGPDEDAVAAGVVSRGLEARVRLLGPVPPDEVLERMRAARALVLPSLWEEPLPMVLVEAAAVGTPIIASRIGGTPEVVVEGETGHLVPAGDAPALAAALTDAIARPERYAAMGRAARLRWEAHFSANVAYDRLLEAYDRASRVVAHRLAQRSSQASGS